VSDDRDLKDQEQIEHQVRLLAAAELNAGSQPASLGKENRDS
jgi:hypothetical protein